MKEPKWIPNPMTGKCPVPNGHDTEVLFKDGGTCRDGDPEGWDWGDDGGNSVIIEYRDWTEYNKQKENDRPDLSFEASYNRLDKLSNMQAKRLNEMEGELTKTLRELEAMIKRLSKNGDAITLQVALTSRNRLSEYLYLINK